MKKKRNRRGDVWYSADDFFRNIIIVQSGYFVAFDTQYVNSRDSEVMEETFEPYPNDIYLGNSKLLSLLYK